MNFVSALFIGFLLATLFVFYMAPSRLRLPILMIASYVFYASWSVPFIGIILFSSSADYWMSKLIHRFRNQPLRQKSALVFAITLNLLILGFFKYYYFLSNSYLGLAHLLKMHWVLPPALKIILPLGISFYTFEAISYIVDVYRGQKPARSWLDYNFYIMYFPHLISGPIVRFSELWTQYRKPLSLPTLERIGRGTELILLGFVFKILIADNAANIADPYFANPHGSVLSAYLAILAFTVQIYFDFMGYNHIARGVSFYFNIDLPVNFNHPYQADNISDFWRRWHISLSRWIRDYLYIPMGGSQGTWLRTAWVLIITMLIAGAWHGAGWGFILWGAYHGLLLAGYHLYKLWRDRALMNWVANPVYRIASHLLTFYAVMMGWIFFRAGNFDILYRIFRVLFNFGPMFRDAWRLIASGQYDFLWTTLALLSLCFAGPWCIRWLSNIYRPLPFPAKVQVACALVLLLWLLSGDTMKPFIYFQF